jgi:hypothetical protein
LKERAACNPLRRSFVHSLIMRDAIEFLRKSAEELRELASSAPDISEHLRRLADELEATAADLERGGGIPT